MFYFFGQSDLADLVRVRVKGQRKGSAAPAVSPHQQGRPASAPWRPWCPGTSASCRRRRRRGGGGSGGAGAGGGGCGGGAGGGWPYPGGTAGCVPGRTPPG